MPTFHTSPLAASTSDSTAIDLVSSPTVGGDDEAIGYEAALPYLVAAAVLPGGGGPAWSDLLAS